MPTVFPNAEQLTRKEKARISQIVERDHNVHWNSAGRRAVLTRKGTVDSKCQPVPCNPSCDIRQNDQYLQVVLSLSNKFERAGDLVVTTPLAGITTTHTDRNTCQIVETHYYGNARFRTNKTGVRIFWQRLIEALNLSEAFRVCYWLKCE